MRCLWWLWVALAVVGNARAGDWPQWGGKPQRNMVSREKNLPVSFSPGQWAPDSPHPDPSTTKNLKWAVRLGTETYGTPTIAGGKVFVGTNNGVPRDPRLRGDRHVLMCFDEATGRFLWQLVAPKLRQVSNFNGDFRGLGITSSPTVEGDRVYMVTNRSEVVCLDAHGLADGNDGPFTDEGRYIAPDNQPAMTPGPLDADILWRFDLRRQAGICPHDSIHSSILLVGDQLYLNTGNGVDPTHTKVPRPDAPALIVLDKHTGRWLGRDDEKIGHRIFHCAWSSPSVGHGWSAARCPWRTSVYS